jgi:4-amino-4-deoxy-L-arabinose transferase-like glycosyltransferase
VLAALFPPLVLLNVALLTEQPFLLAELGAVLTALYSARARGSPGWAALAGVCCGLAALARANGIVLALPIALGLLAAGRGRGVRAWAAPAAVAVGAVLALLPWTVRNYVVFDRFVPVTTQSGFGIAGIYNDEAVEREGYRALWIRPSDTREYGPVYWREGADEAEIDDEVRERALDWAGDRPRYVLEAAFLNTARTLELANLPSGGALVDHNLLGLSERNAELARWSFYLLALLALAGAWVLVRRPGPARGPWWMWVTPVLLVLAGSVILGFTRYRVPAYPFLVLLSAVALAEAVRFRRPATS